MTEEDKNKFMSSEEFFKILRDDPSEWKKKILNELFPDKEEYFIVAHTRVQADRWAYYHHIKRNSFIYVVKEEQLFGRKGLVILLPDHFRQERWDRIEEALEWGKRRGRFTVVYRDDK
jgi:hypothetical protein